MARGRYGDGAVFEVKSGKNKGRWIARLEVGEDYRTGRRKRMERSRSTREDALAALTEMRKELDATGTIAAARTLNDWLDYWLDDVVTPTLKPRVAQHYRQVSAKWIRPALGRTQVAKLAPSHIRRLVEHVRTETSAGNSASVHRVLRSCLSEAVREGLCARNVAALVRVPQSTVRREALSVAEGRAVIAHLDGKPDRARWLLALLTGARQAECLGLTWDRVDLKAGAIDISRQLYQLPAAHGCQDESGEPTCGRTRVSYCPRKVLALPDPDTFDATPLEGVYALIAPKTTASRRIIPIPPLLVDALREHRKANLDNPHGLVFVSRTEHYGVRPVSRRVDSMAWDAMLRAAKVSDVPLHSARHTTATLLLELGADVRVIQEVMGHSSAAVSRGYQHVDLTMARRYMDGLGEALG